MEVPEGEILQISEVAISKEFYNCTLLLARIGEKVFMGHLNPMMSTTLSSYNKQLWQILNSSGYSEFDEILLVGKDPISYYRNFGESEGLTSNVQQMLIQEVPFNVSVDSSKGSLKDMVIIYYD